MTEYEIARLFNKYLEEFKYDGRQIHPSTGTPGYDEQEWEAFRFGIKLVLEASRNSILEEAAMTCDMLLSSKTTSEWSRATHDCASAIRKLKLEKS